MPLANTLLYSAFFSEPVSYQLEVCEVGFFCFWDVFEGDEGGRTLLETQDVGGPVLESFEDVSSVEDGAATLRLCLQEGKQVFADQKIDVGGDFIEDDHFTVLRKPKENLCTAQLSITQVPQLPRHIHTKHLTKLRNTLRIGINIQNLLDRHIQEVSALRPPLPQVAYILGESSVVERIPLENKAFSLWDHDTPCKDLQKGALPGTVLPHNEDAGGSGEAEVDVMEGFLLGDLAAGDIMEVESVNVDCGHCVMGAGGGFS